MPYNEDPIVREHVTFLKHYAEGKARLEKYAEARSILASAAIDVYGDVATIPAVIDMYIDQSDQVLGVDDDLQLTTTFDIDANASQEVLWTSANDEIATVDAYGLVEGVAAGEVIITATSVFDPNFSDSITITVEENDVISVSIVEPAQVINTPGYLANGEDDEEFTTLQLTAIVDTYGTPDTTVTWTSSEPGNATVDEETGLVTAVSAGATTITAAAGGQEDTVVITVEEPAVGGVTIVPAAVSLADGTSMQLNVVVDFAGHPDTTDLQAVTWSTDGASEVDVDAETGLITHVSDGSADITATSDFNTDINDTIAVTSL